MRAIGMKYLESDEDFCLNIRTLQNRSPFFFFFYLGS